MKEGMDVLEGVVMDGCDSGRVDDSASPLWRMKDGGGDGWMDGWMC